jgi:thiamine pyridinylase
MTRRRIPQLFSESIFAGLALALLLLPSAERAVAAEPSMADAGTTTLNVGLYPYVPDLAAFQAAVQASWSQVQPNVKLNFVSQREWDGGYSSDPTSANLDVFVFDAIFLQYFRTKGWLYGFDASEIDNQSDFLAFAIDGVKDNGKYYGLPQFGCSSILFYREGDSILANATRLSDVIQDLGRNYSPPCA